MMISIYKVMGEIDQDSRIERPWMHFLSQALQNQNYFQNKQQLKKKKQNRNYN